MADVIYRGPFDAVVTPDGVMFKRGEPVEVTDALAESLARQDFEIVVPADEPDSEED